MTLEERIGVCIALLGQAGGIAILSWRFVRLLDRVDALEARLRGDRS